MSKLSKNNFIIGLFLIIIGLILDRVLNHELISTLLDIMIGIGLGLILVGLWQEMKRLKK